jgi:hypothetical protein
MNTEHPVVLLTYSSRFFDDLLFLSLSWRHILSYDTNESALTEVFSSMTLLPKVLTYLF